MAPQIPPSSPPPHPKKEKKRNIYKYIGSPVETTPPSVYTQFCLDCIRTACGTPLPFSEKPYTHDDKKTTRRRISLQSQFHKKSRPNFPDAQATTHTLQNELWLKNMIWYLVRSSASAFNEWHNRKRKNLVLFLPLLLLLPATVLFRWECGWIDKHNEKKEKSLLALSAWPVQ